MCPVKKIGMHIGGVKTLQELRHLDRASHKRKSTMLKNPKTNHSYSTCGMPYWRPWPVSSIAHIHQLCQKRLKVQFCQQMVHIILTASSGVTAELRTDSQPTSSKLTDKIGEPATPTDPGSMRKRYPWSPCRCRVFIIYNGTICKYQKGYHGLSQFIQINQSGFKAENEFNSESECQHT